MENCLHILGYLQIKTGIINQDNDIRPVLTDVFPANLHVAEYGSQVHEHRDEPHKRHFPVMFNQSSSYPFHQISAQETEISLRIRMLNGTHQVRCVQIPRSFTGYEIIFHGRNGIKGSTFAAPA